ncbi:MFS transporter [Paenibacillus massiliensis]|uniref:MFS transporter n=1 Tax=Paenibacillus massiliensis TaxID=225917 RepID=UPI00046FB292|nr:MFS transporter [Paenibacillus massiliensis]
MQQHITERLWTKHFVILTFVNLLLFLELQMIVPSLPSYVKDAFSASAIQVGLVTSLFALSAIVARVLSTRYLEKGFRAYIVLIGLALALAGTLGYVLAPTVGILLLMRVIFGLGFGLSSTTFPTMASDIVPAKRMGEGMGYFGLSSTLAMSIGPTIGISLLQYGGFNALVYTTCAVIILVVPMTIWLLRQLPDPSKSGQDAGMNARQATVSSEENDGVPLWRKLWLPSFLNYLMAITYGGLLSFMVLFGQEAGLTHAAFFFLFLAGAVLLVRPFAGRLYDRFGHKAIMGPGSLLLLTGLLLLSFARTDGMLYLAAMCYGAGFGSMQPAFQTWMIQCVPARKRGTASSSFLNSTDFGVATGALLLGSIAKWSSYAMMYRISATAIVALVLMYFWLQWNTRRSQAAIELT